MPKGLNSQLTRLEISSKTTGFKQTRAHSLVVEYLACTEDTRVRFAVGPLSFGTRKLPKIFWGEENMKMVKIEHKVEYCALRGSISEEYGDISLMDSEHPILVFNRGYTPIRHNLPHFVDTKEGRRVLVDVGVLASRALEERDFPLLLGFEISLIKGEDTSYTLAGFSCPNQGIEHRTIPLQEVLTADTPYWRRGTTQWALESPQS